MVHAGQQQLARGEVDTPALTGLDLVRSNRNAFALCP
jgi:hypothetical protein